MGAHPGLVPEAFDGAMSYTITNYLRKLKKQVFLENLLQFTVDCVFYLIVSQRWMPMICPDRR